MIICKDCKKDMTDNLSGHPFSDCEDKRILPMQTFKNMIEIKIEAANGADARQQMLDLLGIKTGFIGIDLSAGQDKSVITTVENGEVTDLKVVEEAPKPEQTTRKRRTQAEVKAETLAQNTGSEEPPASAVPEGKVDPETEVIPVEKGPITAEDLTKKAVELGRNGHRDKLMTLLETQFGGATISKKDGKPQLTPEQYPAVMAAFNAIG